MDFPAAHSMDTTWFAVDDDGHVGQFWSSDEGAVPTFARPFGCEAKAIVAAFQHDALEAIWSQIQRMHAPMHIIASRPEMLYAGSNCLLFIDSHAIDQVRHTLSGLPIIVQRVVPLAAPNLCAFHVSWQLHGAARAFDALHEARLCKGCVVLSEDASLSGEGFLHDIGLFYYTCDAYDVAPYQALARPERPLHWRLLPAKLQTMLESCRLPGARFAHSPLIQPLEHTPCDLWRRSPQDFSPEFDDENFWTYLASDGTTRRPLPPPPSTESTQ